MEEESRLSSPTPTPAMIGTGEVGEEETLIVTEAEGKAYKLYYWEYFEAIKTFCSRRVSDGKFRRTNYRLVVQNISSGTSWQVLTQNNYLSFNNDVNTNVIIFHRLYFNF